MEYLRAKIQIWNETEKEIEKKVEIHHE